VENEKNSSKNKSSSKPKAKKLTAEKSTKGQKKGPEARNIGVDVKPPQKTCENDKHCPFHGTASLRGRIFTGKVIRAKVPKNAIIEWSWNRQVPKYERYEKRRTRITVHNPICINAQVGDTVKIMETKKISKTKNFVIIEKQE